LVKKDQPNRNRLGLREIENLKSSKKYYDPKWTFPELDAIINKLPLKTITNLKYLAI